jgi:hypothetical protein
MGFLGGTNKIIEMAIYPQINIKQPRETLSTESETSRMSILKGALNSNKVIN